jgi:XTP/dITP diphosphohydrolase
MKKWVLATGNRGKLAEIRDVLADLDVELVAQSELGIADADETGLTFVENALIKARNACAISGLPALADDSGLIVDALGGAPGLITAHYAGVHGDSERNIAKLLDAMRDVPDDQRGACFYSVIVLLRHAEDPQPVIAEGRWPGRILRRKTGSGGFGYDPVFFDPETGSGAAELGSALKNRISHRGRALARLRELLVTARGL